MTAQELEKELLEDFEGTLAKIRDSKVRDVGQLELEIISVIPLVIELSQFSDFMKSCFNIAAQARYPLIVDKLNKIMNCIRHDIEEVVEDVLGDYYNVSCKSGKITLTKTEVGDNE
jgi:hypothetical protein